LTTLAKAKARPYKTVILQVSLTIATYDLQNIFIVQAIGPTILAINRLALEPSIFFRAPKRKLHNFFNFI
jgi:hypothetical protein